MIQLTRFHRLIMLKPVPYGVKQYLVMKLKVSIGCITASKWPQWYSIENSTIIDLDTWTNKQSLSWHNHLNMNAKCLKCFRNYDVSNNPVQKLKSSTIKLEI